MSAATREGIDDVAYVSQILKDAEEIDLYQKKIICTKN